jgi:hypothetical protein
MNAGARYYFESPLLDIAAEGHLRFPRPERKLTSPTQSQFRLPEQMHQRSYAVRRPTEQLGGCSMRNFIQQRAWKLLLAIQSRSFGIANTPVSATKGFLLTYRHCLLQNADSLRWMWGAWPRTFDNRVSRNSAPRNSAQ